MELGEVYLVNFPNKFGNEFYGEHYALVLTEPEKSDKTLLVAPITSKKQKTKYRGGITIDNLKYQTNPTYKKSYIYFRKIQEIDLRKIRYKKKRFIDDKGVERFEKHYKMIYKLDEEDLQRARDSMKMILKL
ncbi:transcriptional regulator [Streptococcus iniae]|nr:transcriptional regulator [Streptococcus iniae]